MDVLRGLKELEGWRDAHRARGRRIGFVPTMGSLHDGHLALVRRARALADVTLVSVFVNPAQFGPNEDLARYPRDEAGDLEKCGAAGADAVYLPEVADMYPAGHATRVHVDGLTTRLCGPSRPGHFDGVCTVVLKLFNQTGCHVSVFGEKDYQQLAVVRRMVRDLDVPVEVVGHPTVREPDGLALSSRNVYLSPEERVAARSLSRALALAADARAQGEDDPAALERRASEVLEATPGAAVEYVEALDAETLSRHVGPTRRPLVLALAVRFGRTRLIDNRVL